MALIIAGYNEGYIFTGEMKKKYNPILPAPSEL